MQKFRVRLKGFNFIAHLPPAEAVQVEDVLQAPAVPVAALQASPGTKPVARTWLELEARNQREAEALFRAAHAIKRAAAHFVTEKV